jgi:hypothetical protein
MLALDTKLFPMGYQNQSPSSLFHTLVNFLFKGVLTHSIPTPITGMIHNEQTQSFKHQQAEDQQTA